MGKWRRILAEYLCPKACGGQHLPGLGPRAGCVGCTFSPSRHSLSPIGVRTDISPVWHVPAILQHKACVCISATFAPQHLSGPDSHHKPEQSPAANQFYSHLFPRHSLTLESQKCRASAEGWEVWSGLCEGAACFPLDDGEANSQHTSPPEGFELPSGARCSVWGSAQVQTQPSHPDITAQTSGMNVVEKRGNLCIKPWDRIHEMGCFVLQKSQPPPCHL